VLAAVTPRGARRSRAGAAGHLIAETPSWAIARAAHYRDAGAAIAAIVMGTLFASTTAFLKEGMLDGDKAMPYGEIASLFA
jgi:hypothetical protein